MKRSIAVILLVAMTCCIFAACNTRENTDNDHITLTGRFLRSDLSDTVYIITDDNAPIEMWSKAEAKALFDGLESGDRIMISCGPIRESYPASTDVYTCEFVEKGSIEDISSDVLESLRSLGRIK